VILTVTNLRGVPYALAFTGLSVQNYRMTLHADTMRFSIGPGATAAPGVLPLGGPVDPTGWGPLRDAAIASGAFPVGLAPRPLKRPAGDYANRQWYLPGVLSTVAGAPSCGATHTFQPDWTTAFNDKQYDFLCVDGGAINNEPIEHARAALTPAPDRARDSSPQTPAALVMIEPFPTDAPFEVNDDFHTSFTFYRLFPKIIRTLINQARFKPEELNRALDPNVCNQFLVTPTRYAADPAQTPNPPRADYDLASGGLDGFAGFLEREFRAHDYHLGRCNCRRFLQQHFVLPEKVAGADNPLFARWPAGLRDRHRVWRDGRGKTVAQDAVGAVACLPIVPVLPGAPAAPQPTWPAPSYTSQKLKALQKQLTDRTQRVAQRLVDKLDGWFTRRLLSNAWWLKRGEYVGDLIGVVERDLRTRGLLH
jgi:hypothetical protein